MKIEISKEGRAWSWMIKAGRNIIAGGYAGSRKAAQNDAKIWAGGAK
jgi:hypothetical protein